MWGGDLASVQSELNKGVDVSAKSEKDGLTPLHQSVRGDHREIDELLIAPGITLVLDQPETPFPILCA